MSNMPVSADPLELESLVRRVVHQELRKLLDPSRPKILDDFEPPPVDVAVREALDDYVARRKQELGGNEPLLEPTT